MGMWELVHSSTMRYILPSGMVSFPLILGFFHLEVFFTFGRESWGGYMMCWFFSSFPVSFSLCSVHFRVGIR